LNAEAKWAREFVGVQHAEPKATDQPGCDIEDRGIGEKVKDNDAIENARHLSLLPNDLFDP